MNDGRNDDTPGAAGGETVGGLPNEHWQVLSRYYHHDGLRLHYLDATRRDLGAGAEGDRCLLMLHGLTAHADAWRSVIRRTETAQRVVCPDFRGHGFSEWTREGYWLNDYARDILALVDELGIRQVDLFGHSLGARVAMVLAPMLGDRLRSLVLSDTGPEVSRTAAQQALSINSSAKSVPGFKNLDKLKEFLREQQPDWTDEAIEIRAATLYRPNWVDMLVNRGDPETTWILGRAGLREVPDMWNGLSSITAPVLILWATRSFLLDEDLLARMVAAADRAAVAKFDLGHYLPYEDPDGVTAVLDSFLADPGSYQRRS